jgi:hypothetical protein
MKFVYLVKCANSVFLPLLDRAAPPPPFSIIVFLRLLLQLYFSIYSGSSSKSSPPREAAEAPSSELVGTVCILLFAAELLMVMALDAITLAQHITFCKAKAK